MSDRLVLLKGSDKVLLADEARERLDAFVGDADRNEILDQFIGDDYELNDVVMAATAVSMFGDRVVVARNCSRFGAADVYPLVRYIGDPNPTTKLLLVWDKPLAAGASSKPVPKKLADAIKAAGGGVVSTDVAANKGARKSWFEEQFAASGANLDSQAKNMLIERVGEDVSRVPGILRVLTEAFGDGQTLSATDIGPYLGESGAVPPWDLTDAIDRGDVKGALNTLGRMTRAGERHPLQVMASLTTHIQRIASLDGAKISGEKQAAEFLGMKGSTFPAKKALAQSNKLGHEKSIRALTLIADADVELKGATGTESGAVLEVLVGRLAALASGRR